MNITMKVYDQQMFKVVDKETIICVYEPILKKLDKEKEEDILLHTTLEELEHTFL